ncbi:class I adenylate-forming enzyme family protein [Ferrimicrobium sp.]|jgi:acyl-CoA synthetase (AMP-forming)/AMP-acid ligase II|uniref:class I adenylate-forming enzyme family protein n=1 Tax=Ferrimicrobium sp. TaxID=2926050 RepID=UPI00261A4194|nr:AMP-binding protein [Ferrimicrobium sp.]
MKPDLSLVDPLDYNLATRLAVGDMLTRVSWLFPDRLAIVDPDGSEISYRAFEVASEGVARSLIAEGLERQEPVALLLPNSWRFLASFFGCAKAGLIACPINIQLDVETIAWILEDATVTTVIIDRALLPTLEKAFRNNRRLKLVIVVGDGPEPDVGDRRCVAFDSLLVDGPGVSIRIEDRDIVHCLYTSGTTSRPKGVLTSHVAVMVASLSNAIQVGHPRGEEYSVLPIVLPLFHTTALDTLALPVLATGGTVVLGASFAPDTLLDVVERYRATHLMLLPAMYQALLASESIARRDLSSVRLCIYAMAPMPRDLIGRLARAFPNSKILLGSGQTECVPATVFQWPSNQYDKSDSWGPPAITVDARIIDPDGAIAERDAVGEIVYRSPHTMSGYWNNAEANRVAFEHGWFHSGDVGMVDRAGVIWFVDRLKDIVKSGGENVSSVEVERVLLGHPEVLECAVVGSPDPRWGEAVTAVVVVREGTDLEDDSIELELLNYCKEHLPRFAVPKRFIFETSLPKTATGKIQKGEIRSRLREHG